MLYNGVNPNSLEDLNEVANQAIRNLKEVRHEFDTIATQGMSGVIIGSIVSFELNRPLVIVRKDSDRDHHGGGATLNKVPGVIVNGYQLGKRYIFLDDFISLGGTRRRVVEALAQYDSKSHCVGQLEYNGNCEPRIWGMDTPNGLKEVNRAWNQKPEPYGVKVWIDEVKEGQPDSFATKASDVLAS